MTGEVEEFPTSRNSDPAHQFKYCNFRPGTEPDRKARGTDAAVDIRGEQAGNGVFDFALLLVVPEAAENAMRRTQSRQHTNHLPFSLRIPANVVSSQND